MKWWKKRKTIDIKMSMVEVSLLWKFYLSHNKTNRFYRFFFRALGDVQIVLLLIIPTLDQKAVKQVL